MPKHGNIFTNWFKSSKQSKQQKNDKNQPFKNRSNNDISIEENSQKQSAVKRSPLIPRAPTTNETVRSDLSPRRKTSIFGLTFGLASSTGSSRLSLLSGGNSNKQSVQHKSTSCIETQCNQYEQQQQNGSIIRKCSANIDNILSNESNKSPATPPRKQSKSGSITSANFLQHLANCASQLHPRSQTGSASSSIQNLPSGGNLTPTPPRSPTNSSNQVIGNSNQTNCTTAPSDLNRNSSFKQTSVIFQSLDKGSAFTPISNYSNNQANTANNQKPYLQRQATTQHQKQIQFQQQHHSTNQSYSFQKVIYSQQSLNEYGNNQMINNNPANIVSSGLITTINESFTESNQDSSDAEIVEVFAGNSNTQNKTQNDTLDLIDEQLLFNDEKKDRPSSPAPFNLTPTDQQDLKQSTTSGKQQQDINLQDKNNNQLNDELINRNDKEIVVVKKKTSFADEKPLIDENSNKDGSIFPKCKLNRSDTLKRDSLKENLLDSLRKNLKENLENKDDLNNLKEKLDENNGFKRKSIDINELVDSTEQLDQGALEETDSFGDLVNNEEDFSLYENRTGLGDDMKFLASMPELCDITFLVGETREPVCAVRAVLGSRSRVFNKLLYGQKAYSNQQYNNNLENDLPPEKSTETKSTRRSIFGRRESIIDDSTNLTDSKRSREESITGSLLRYSKSKKFKENKDTKLKLFLKRGSEPMLNGLPIHQQIQPPVHQTMIIEEFEPDVFRQLIEYVHTGCVTLQARTLLGLMNAADYYGLDELRKSCMGFVAACITVDTVCALLASAERYIQYKCTKSLVQRVLEFVDNHGNEVLSLGSFALLPEHVVRLILSREELKAEELIKFQAALSWSQRYCDSSPGTADLREVIEGFFECIEFYKIPATVLMREVHPLNIVPDHIIMNALAYQADPKSIDIRKVESPNRFRRMTLPYALNISGSELLNLHRQSLVIGKSERSASTSSGYNTEGSMFSANNTSSGNLGLSASIKRKKGRDEDGPSDESTSKNKSKDKKDKEKDKQSRVGKRRGSRPFRRAFTLFEGKHHS